MTTSREEEHCLTCPSSGTLAFVLVEGEQGAVASVGAGVVWVTCRVLGSLAVWSGKSKGTATGGAAWYWYAS